MKASQLIEQLQALVQGHGDFEQVVACDTGDEYRPVKVSFTNGRKWLEIDCDWDQSLYD